MQSISFALLFFPRFLSFIVFAISKSPQGYASAVPQCAQLGENARCHICELAAVERRENDAIRKVVWVVKPRPYEGQVAGIARTSADVPWCHSTSATEWITQQMFNVKARLSRQPNTHMHTPPCMHIHRVQFITTLQRVAPQGVKPRHWCSPSCDFVQK